jgi:hypothetical protein
MDNGNMQQDEDDRHADQHRNEQVNHAIVIESSDADDPHDMWVRPILNPQQLERGQHNANIPPGQAAALPLTPTSQRNQRRQQPQPQRQQRSQRRRLEAWAVESSACDDPSSECVESDTDAQDLYRSAIRGVRNARQARQQIRSATEHCPVCAKFAAFIAHFM